MVSERNAGSNPVWASISHLISKAYKCFSLVISQIRKLPLTVPVCATGKAGCQSIRRLLEFAKSVSISGSLTPRYQARQAADTAYPTASGMPEQEDGDRPGRDRERIPFQQDTFLLTSGIPKGALKLSNRFWKQMLPTRARSSVG